MIRPSECDGSATAKPLFAPGRLVATPGALKQLTPHDISAALARHLRGDWGELDDDDKRENDFSLDKELRLLSAYKAANGTKFWIITEADRSSTCILLPSEY